MSENTDEIKMLINVLGCGVERKPIERSENESDESWTPKESREESPNELSPKDRPNFK